MLYLEKITSHLDRLISVAHDYGMDMWPSAVDISTGRYPEGTEPPRRVYRLIGAPRGSTFYWDQPLIVTACAVSELSGNDKYIEAVKAYTESFLAECVADNGMFRWGNHAYYDVFEKEVVEFHGGPHELRPLTPAWDIIWQYAPEVTAHYIDLMGKRHVYDPETGGFNRHDTGNKDHAFIEAGGILAESLAWLYQKKGSPEILERALKIARYSFQHRGEETGLVQNQPDHDRWDAKVCTTEIGLWAGCLLKASNYTGNDEFAHMAEAAVAAYLNYGWDSSAKRYYGQLSVATGAAVVPEKTGYWPRKYADIWNSEVQWPNHDYPMALAESCLDMYLLTGREIFREAVKRWAHIALDTRPGKAGGWAYAENYGQAINFLTRAGRQLDNEEMLAGSATLADEAVEVLYREGMFQGYPESMLYESVDGVGQLCKGLILLETHKDAGVLALKQP